jgi:hypothetical protein
VFDHAQRIAVSDEGCVLRARLSAMCAGKTAQPQQSATTVINFLVLFIGPRRNNLQRGILRASYINGLARHWRALPQ